jgi:hypothetical protein
LAGAMHSTRKYAQQVRVALGLRFRVLGFALNLKTLSLNPVLELHSR